MIRMFTNARTFNQNIGGWDVSNVVSMNDMFKGASLSIRNYDNLLYGWSRQSLKENVEFHAGNSKYNYLGALAKNRIIDDFGWKNIFRPGEFPKVRLFSNTFGLNLMLIAMEKIPCLTNQHERFLLPAQNLSWPLIPGTNCRLKQATPLLYTTP